MADLMLKCSPVTGGLSLGHPMAKPGFSDPGRALHYRITGIPEGTPTSEVVRLADRTTILTDMDSPGADYVIAWSELGEGRIIRRGDYRLANQV